MAFLFSPCLTEESSGTSDCCQWGCSHLEIRLGKSGYLQHSCDRQFGSFSLFDLVGA